MTRNRYNPSVLLIDDHPKIARLVVELLARFGLDDVETVPDGEMALIGMATKPYGLVICDMLMEPMNGIDVLRSMRADKRLVDVPFILTETTFNVEQVRTAHALGADAFLLKPFDTNLFRTKLKRVLAPGARRRRPVVDAVMPREFTSMRELMAQA